MPRLGRVCPTGRYGEEKQELLCNDTEKINTGKESQREQEATVDQASICHAHIRDIHCLTLTHIVTHYQNSSWSSHW